MHADDDLRFKVIRTNGHDEVMARAYLYSIGELDLHDAVDALQEHAERHGLIAEIGQDAVQAIMAEVFRRTRRMAISSPA
jgi:hypothetical protein